MAEERGSLGRPGFKKAISFMFTPTKIRHDGILEAVGWIIYAVIFLGKMFN